MDKKILDISFGIIFFVFLVLTITFIAGFFKPLYYLSYKNDSPKEHLSNVLGYFFGINTLSNDFNAREISHLSDVKNILYYLFAVWSLSLLSLIFYLKTFKERISGYFFLTSGIIDISFSGFGIIFAILFEKIFLIFHKIFFPPGSYMFPVDSLIKEIFPDRYFLIAFVFIILLSLAGGSGIIIFYYKNVILKLQKGKSL